MTVSPSLVPSSRLARHPHRRHGFTLVELLVVIGIIALLISILLPTLASSRRSANSVKCLASLKEIGNAFSMYAIDNKGMYPASRDNQIKASNGAALDRRWTDYIAKYMSKRGGDFTGSQDVGKIRENSVLWGCPEWTRSFEFNPNLPSWHSQNVYTGYGMQYYPGYPEKGPNNENLAIRNTAARRGYQKQAYWARKGADRLMIADSSVDIIQLPPSGYTANVRFSPYPMMPASPATSNDFWVESRHQKPGTSLQAAKSIKGINGLFADGHAEAVTPKQAYNAIRMPGGDFAPNVAK